MSLVKAAEASAKGIADTEVISLHQHRLKLCQLCGEGWGICRSEHVCQFGDDGFNEIRDAVEKADVLVFVSPVYWGEVSEEMKTFIDRLRRCEASKLFEQKPSALTNKKCILVASAGGSGNGILTTLEQMERAVRHMGGVAHDYFGVNRWNKDYKTAALKEAVRAVLL